MDDLTQVLLRGLVALAVSAAIGPAALVLLRRAGILDRPSVRSSHVDPVPRGGGVGPALGALVAVALTPALDNDDRLVLVAAAGAFGLLGLLEDVVGVGALRRLSMQLTVAVVATAFLLGDATGSWLWQLALVAVGVVWLVGYVNAFNFMDGVDGSSVAQAVGAGIIWVVVGQMADAPILSYGGAIVAGAALGFAPFNIPRARMFLGDVGSYFLGAAMAVLAVLGLQSGVPAEAVLAPLVVYVADTGVTLARRVARGACWYEPHREHAYQRLTDIGWSHVAVAAMLGASVLACGALGLVSTTESGAARLIADVAIVAISSAYLLAPRWLPRVGTAVAVA